MSGQENKVEDEGPRETKVSASVRYFSELGDKNRKKMRYIMALNSEEGPVHFYAKYLNQSEGLKKTKIEKVVIRISPEGFCWIKVGGTDKKRLKKEAVDASFAEAPVYKWQNIITWDTHAKLEEIRVIFKDISADVKKEVEERKKKEELLKKQQSKLRLTDRVPPGCVMYRFKSSMFKEISECVNETIMTIQRTKGLSEEKKEEDLKKEDSEEEKEVVFALPKLSIGESNKRIRNRSASLGSKDDSMPNSARSQGSNQGGQGAGNLTAPTPKRRHAKSVAPPERIDQRDEIERENIFWESTYDPSSGSTMMGSYVPMAETFGGF